MPFGTILENLNPHQSQAVTAPMGNTLVLAGAGSGKTRVLVSRIGYLMEEYQLSPHAIMAVTFTNKAAGEMKERLGHLLNRDISSLWVGTFHGLAHRLLRRHFDKANLPKLFQILDSDDQLRLVKRVVREMGLDEEKWPPKTLQWYINGRKDEGLRASHIAPRDAHTKVMVSVYAEYEQACQRAGVVDFAEILLRAHELLLNNDDLREHYQSRFDAILVDEFQDTNTIQYAFIKLLAAKAHVMAVGDDDQSIYGWRGAKIENIQRFSKDFKDTTVIRLEQNYRSTKTILEAANSLIANNGSRLGKELWTADDKGQAIDVYSAFNEVDEARFVAERIKLNFERGAPLTDTAVLYRSNAQSRVIEEALIKSGIQYRIIGGVRFFERAEIKDVLSYLRLTANPHDDSAFERVVNFPTRGIGEKTLVTLRERAREDDVSLWQAAEELINEAGLTQRAKNSLLGFLNLIADMTERLEGDELHEKITLLIKQSGLEAHFSKIKGEKSQSRLDNMQELVNAAKQFHYDNEEDDELSAFLSHAALEAGEGQAPPEGEYVTLMTLHAAKGLEFPHVFMVGMEEGLFPSRQSYDEPSKLEEERRLCYVGMTRAMQTLTMSFAEIRRLYGREEYHRASRFLAEIPQELINEVRIKTHFQPTKMRTNTSTTSRPKTKLIDDSQPFQLGQMVTHSKFGQGMVINYEGQGAHQRVQVQFEGHGAKWLVVAYANLKAASQPA